MDLFSVLIISLIIGCWGLFVNKRNIIIFMFLEIMYFAALFFLEAYEFNLSVLESVHITLMSKTSINADEEFYLIQSFILEVHRNQFIISEFYVNNFYNPIMTSHLNSYLNFLEEVQRTAVPSNFLNESNYNTYIQTCDDNINLIRPIIEKVVLKGMENREFFLALEDKEYHIKNIFENGFI